MMAIGRLKQVNITKLFAHEAHDFTPWLRENIDALGERLGIPLVAIESEKQVGSFNLDLLAEGPNGEMVIIENQLYKTDHDHLGKVLTYLVNLESKTAVWITCKVRDEHKQVFEWLNNNTPNDVRFYLVEMEAFAIGDDRYAPWFNIVVGPSETGKAIASERKNFVGRLDRLQSFWEKFLSYAHEKKQLGSITKAPRDNYINIGVGRSGFWLEFLVYEDHAVVRLVIDFDKDTGKGNKLALESLREQCKEIEADFGEPLVWDRRDNARYACVKLTLTNITFKDEASWHLIHEWMLEKMNRLDKALRDRVRELKVHEQ